MKDTERIKERLSITDVVGSYITLVPAGVHFKAKCPFHNEQTPSFFISRDRDGYHCFGCGRGGDIFSFVEEIEGVDFRTALQLLAERAGVTLSDSREKGDGEKAVLYEVLDTATKWYEVQFRKDSKAIAYMEERGLTRETMKEFRVGYAPKGWTNLYDTLARKGISTQILEKAGLVIRGSKGYIDRFTERIMFPLCDTQGHVIGFSGRIFRSPEAGGDKNLAKYVNSPDGPLYHKSNVLYGYDKAKRAMMQEKKAVVVEGQFDLLMAHQTGSKNVVALSGTALTQKQSQLLARFTDTVVLAFDGDSAGMQAARKSALVLFQEGQEVQMVLLPEGVDPAEYIKEHPKEWETLVSTAKDCVRVWADVLARESKGDTHVAMRMLEKDIYPILSFATRPVYIDASLQLLATAVKVSPNSLRNDFEAWRKKNPRQNLAQKQQVRVPTISKRDLAEGLIEWLLTKETFKEQAQSFKEELDTLCTLHGEEEYRAEGSEHTMLVASLQYESEKDAVSALRDVINDIHIGFLNKKIDTLHDSLEEKQDTKLLEEIQNLVHQREELTQKRR